MERRKGTTPDNGHRRRDKDREDFALLREKFLLGLGAITFVGFSLAAVFGTIHSPEIAAGCLGIAAALLGAPTVMRWDEKRGK